MTPYIILLFTFVSYIANVLVHNHLRRITTNSFTSSLSGDMAAKKILAIHRIKGVKVKKVELNSENLYDPISKIIQLGPNIYGCYSIYAVAVASHEACHALDFQYLRFLYFPLSLINKFIMIPIFLLSFIFTSSVLHLVLTTLYLLVFIFKLMVEVMDEIRTNKRAIKMLTQINLVSTKEIKEAKQLYKWFNLTYITSLPMKVFVYH